jgi:hypothetical protein
MTHEEIARELQVSSTSITSDIQYLRNQAKESIKEYTTEQYQVCLTVLAGCYGTIQLPACDKCKYLLALLTEIYLF